MDNKLRKKPRGNNRGKNNKNSKNIAFVALLLLFGLIIWAGSDQTPEIDNLAFSEVIKQANSSQIEKIEIDGDELKLYTSAGDETPANVSRKEPGSSIYEQGLTNRDIQVDIKEPSDTANIWLTVGGSFIIPILMFAGIFWLIKSAQGQGNQAMSFGKSRAKLYGNEKKKVSFKDVAGSEEAKQDLGEVVEFLKFPKKFQNLGARIPKGVMLVGPPGTGKTMLARAVAGEAGVPFFNISGSEFVEMFVGVGASRVRDLFAKAAKNSPCIIFIDEIDAVGRKRGSGMGGGHDEREQTLNQILVEMDGFQQGTNVIVLAATNRVDVLDPALLRPGRFDRRVNIGLPDRQDRKAILEVHFEKKPTDSTVKISDLAAKTAGSSGADLANIANEAAIVAARHNRKVINNNDIVSAFEKVAIGPERRNKIMSDHEKEMTAYHEAGHAIVGHVLPDSDMVHKVTIIPRGGTGGVTWFIPPEDKSYHSIIEYKDVLARMLGGRIAEEVIYGRERVTTGAGSDLRKAAELARDMVANQGMGKKLRDQVFHVDEGMMMDRMVHEKMYSEETAKIIDGEVEDLINEAATRARDVIKHNIKLLEVLKDKLIVEETLEAEEVIKVLEGSTMPKSATLY
jgi:cell division protease FtsH